MPKKVYGERINMYMAISKESYEDLKEYWDYQRVLEYNKELLRHRLNKLKANVFSSNNFVGELDVNSMFNDIWTNVQGEDLETPLVGWIPQDEKYRFEWEGVPDNTVKLPKYKGRPVMLRAKGYEDNDI